MDKVLPGGGASATPKEEPVSFTVAEDTGISSKREIEGITLKMRLLKRLEHDVIIPD